LTLHDVDAAFERALVQKVGEQRFRFWFSNIKLTWDEGRLTVGVPNRFFQELLEKSFSSQVLDAASEALGGPVELRFAIDAELFRENRDEQARVDAAHPPLKPDVTSTKPRRRWLRLEEFVVGPSNRVAHAAALHFLERPDVSPHPTTFFGPPGVGKTHLLEGACVELRRTLGDGAVLFITAEEFTNHFLHAMHERRLNGFRKQFREAHALFVDDIHFFARKKATQEEFLHTFEAMRRQGRPVALTCVAHPTVQEELIPELRDRLLGGGVWPLEPPDAETRRALLRTRCERLQVALPPEVVDYLAEGLRGNVRELEGALHAVLHHARVHARPVTRELAQAATVHLARPSARAIQLRDIEQAVCHVLELDRGSLQRRARSRAASQPRMLAVYLARRHTGASYAEISRHFGSVNHTTAIAAERKVRQWLAENATLLVAGRAWPVSELVERVGKAL